MVLGLHRIPARGNAAAPKGHTAVRREKCICQLEAHNPIGFFRHETPPVLIRRPVSQVKLVTDEIVESGGPLSHHPKPPGPILHRPIPSSFTALSPYHLPPSALIIYRPLAQVEELTEERDEAIDDKNWELQNASKAAEQYCEVQP